MSRRSPAALLQAFDAALSAHDVEGALALLADDATIRYEPPPPPPAPAVYHGKGEIRGLIHDLVAQGVVVQAEGYEGEGARAVSRGRCVYAAAHEALGCNPVALEGEAAAHGDRIMSLTFTFGPESLAKIHAAAAARR